MQFKKLFLLVFPTLLFAQLEYQETLPANTYLDSIKATFVNHNTSNCIDNRWMQEMVSQDLFEELYLDITEMNVDSMVQYELSQEKLKQNLLALNKKTPFEITHNSALENVIKKFLKERKYGIERLMAISDYYFPMFEDKLAKYNLPLEIKYLAIVESALNPKAKSRVGAAGLWQFMYPTGKQFNLEVDSYIDERYDPLKATEAACQYLQSLYTIFGDWSLVLASYNAGPGNVSKAIRRANGNQDYWSIRKYLPRETANYVPAFLATLYIYEYQNELGLKPTKKNISYFETDTLMVKKDITFQQIADVLDVSIEEIAFFNPIYKLEKINYREDKAQYLRLSKEKIGVFISNEEKIYDYLDYLSTKKEVIDSTLLEAEIEEERLPKIIYHTVRRGQNLGYIAQKYNTTISEIKKQNKLRSNIVKVGQKLKINGNDNEVNGMASDKKSSTTKTHIVKKGETLSSIAKKYSISIDEIKRWNDISGSKIKPKMKLKIKG